jgi:hypothetical protein
MARSLDPIEEKEPWPVVKAGVLGFSSQRVLHFIVQC